MDKFLDKMSKSMDNQMNNIKYCRICGRQLLQTDQSPPEKYNEELNVEAHMECLKKLRANKRRRSKKKG